MGRNKNKRKRQRNSFMVKKKKTKQKDYMSDGASATTNMYALKTERYWMIAKLVLGVIGIIVGIYLIVNNVRDDNFCLEISNFKLQCSLAGLAISIISLIALFNTNLNINIKNEK